MHRKPMRSETGSSLVAVLATLAIIGALAAAFVPAMLHPSSGSATSTTPAPQQAVGAARTAVQTINAQQGRTATTP
jgi:type II secretory pathway pseudopilin PulG